MPNVLEVKIIGDVTDLQKSLKQAEALQAQYTESIAKTSAELKESISVSAGYKKAIDDLNTAYKNGTVSAKDYQKQLSNLQRDEKETTVVTANLRKELANLKREQKELGNGFQKDLVPKAANGGNALMQISRIAQDAPFGFIAIGNNVTASVEAFVHLKNQAGSTGGALKAVASSILGSGGILLAVSLVTTGLTVMAQKGIKLEDVLDSLTGGISSSRKEMQTLNAEVAKSAQAQISSVNAYVSAAKNINLSMNDRITAVKKLQSEYPAYFANLTQEQILNGDVSKAVDDVTKAIRNKARAMALTDKLVDLAGKEEEIYSNLNNFIVRLSKELGLNVKETFELSKAINTLVKSGKDFDKVSSADLGALPERLKQYVLQNGALKEIQNNLKSNLYQQDQLTKKINESTAAQLGLEQETKKTAKTRKEDVTPRVEAIPKLTPVKSTDDQLDKLLKIMRDQLSEDLTNLKEKGVEINIPIQAIGQIQSFSAYARALKQAEEDTKIFADGAGSAINALAGELSSSLATGNAALDAFVGSVIQGLAQVATAQLTGLIAKQAVATASLSTDAAVSTGNAVVAATETAASTGPAAAFVLPALVGAAIGFIAAAFSGIKFAHGGIVPGGSFTGDKIPAMLNSGETVMNSQQQANTLMAIANGNSNSLQGNRVSSVFVLDTKLRGADILLSVKREERKR